MFKVLTLGSPDNASGWFRIRQVMNRLAELGLIQHESITSAKDEIMMELMVEASDLIVAHYVTSRGFIELIKGKYPDKKIVLDFDDNVFEVPPSSDAYAEWGTEDVEVKVGKKVLKPWQSGETEGFNIYENRKRLEDIEWMCRHVDCITCASAPLVDYMGQFCKKTAYIPNLIDFRLVPNIPELGSDRINLFWQGTSIHKFEFASIIDDLALFMEENPDVDFYTRGMKMKIKGYKSRIHSLPWVQFQAVMPTLALSGMHVGVIPMRMNAFNFYKAESKWLEMASCGIPCVVQTPSPYARFIKNGKTGLLFKNGKEMREALWKLTVNADYRYKMATNARKWVYKNRNLDKWIYNIADFYKSL